MKFQELKNFFEKYERYLMPSMLIFGVVVDFITFRTIEIKTAFILLSFHLIIAGISIAFINIYDAKRGSGKVLRYFRLLAPFLIQFTFGALLSASFIFYWFSGTISVSWPFILLIALLMASNDVFREHYLKPSIQIGVYYFILFSIFSLVLPFIFNSLSVWIFVLAGFSSLAVITLFVKFLSHFVDTAEWQRSFFSTSIAVVFLSMNALYFLNLIPPIPLGIREAGVYHNIERVSGEYILDGENENIFQKLIPGQRIHVENGERVYVYSAIFAPADLDTMVVHEWQYFDSETQKWVEAGRFSFPIVGGRQDGFRGFSFKENVREGKWRVDVETERGQVLGRVRFKVIK